MILGETAAGRVAGLAFCIQGLCHPWWGKGGGRGIHQVIVWGGTRTKKV